MATVQDIEKHARGYQPFELELESAGVALVFPTPDKVSRKSKTHYRALTMTGYNSTEAYEAALADLFGKLFGLDGVTVAESDDVTDVEFNGLMITIGQLYGWITQDEAELMVAGLAKTKAVRDAIYHAADMQPPGDEPDEGKA